MLFRRRDREINQIKRLQDFLESWDDPQHPQNAVTIDLGHTEYGNINITNIPGDYRGYTLSRWHPRFVESLEEEVKELVMLLVERYNWVTYSSCQGHHYGRLGLASSQRHIGIFPRSDLEQDTIKQVLKATAWDVNRQYRFSTVRVDVTDGQLEADGIQYRVINLFFRRRWWATWKAYFRSVNVIYEGLVLRIKDEKV